MFGRMLTTLVIGVVFGESFVSVAFIHGVCQLDIDADVFSLLSKAHRKYLRNAFADTDGDKPPSWRDAWLN